MGDAEEGGVGLGGAWLEGTASAESASDESESEEAASGEEGALPSSISKLLSSVNWSFASFMSAWCILALRASSLSWESCLMCAS